MSKINGRCVSDGPHCVGDLFAMWVIEIHRFKDALALVANGLHKDVEEVNVRKKRRFFCYCRYLRYFLLRLVSCSV